jgi:GNAT superfamily N-acetyltransferase
LPAVKALLDAHRAELGFVPLPALRQAQERGWLSVAAADDLVLGAIDWWARRDGVVVLYSIAVTPAARGRGAGRLLVTHLIDWSRARAATGIRLKCPADLPSNGFYARLGFHLAEQDAGKRRPLNCWTLALGPMAADP